MIKSQLQSLFYLLYPRVRLGDNPLFNLYKWLNRIISSLQFACEHTIASHTEAFNLPVKMHLTPPPPGGLGCCPVVLLMLTCCLLLLPLWESVIVLCFVVSYFMSILILQSSWWALLNLSSWCLVKVEWLFLAVPWGCLQFVIVVCWRDVGKSGRPGGSVFSSVLP